MFLRIQSANIVIFIVILCNYLAATAVEMKKTVLVLLTALVLSACGPKDRFIQVTGHAQGGVYTVKVNLKGVSVTPEEIRDSVDAILVRVDTTLSGYNKGSLLSRFNAGETIRPNGLFLDMYRIGYGWYERSGGVLDFAAGPLFDAWGFGFKSGEMPTDETVAAIKASCGMGLLKPSMTPRADGTLSVRDVRLDGTDAPVVLNYNAIAQGFTCDLVAAYLYSIGAKDMLEKILNENWFGFDVMVATPDMMGELGKMGMGRILGPKGLMPNPKTGTVTMDLATAISEIKRGKIAYRVDRDGNLNISIARCSFEEAKIADNLNTVLETIAKSRPSTVKGKFIKSCVLHTTMGPGMKITFDAKN